jgi:hypothetical protein
MSEFSVRSDSVDVEQIMRQIRARIREKRGADYTEAELQQLATVKLEKFLDPRGLRSDLVEQFRRHRVVSPEPPKYEFEDTTLYETHRGALRWIRKVLHPILKLFINPNPLIHALHVQKNVNAEFHKRFRQREEMDPLYYEVIHNLVVEVTRLGIEVHNLKMRVESLSSRLEFDERRARSLEGVVQYRQQPQQNRRQEQEPRHHEPRQQPPAPAPAAAAQGVPTPSASPAPVAASGAPSPGQGQPGQGGNGERRRRRRRRRRRPGQTMADGQQRPFDASAAGGGASGSPAEHAHDGGDVDDGADDDGPDDHEGPEGSQGAQ